jgi:hypothetical protein
MRRRLLPTLVIAVVLLGHAAAIAAGREAWPFSDYTMYARRSDLPSFPDRFGPGELVEHRVVAVFAVDPPFERPLASGQWLDDRGPQNPELLQRAIRAQLSRHDDESELRAILANLFARFEARRADGRIGGPALAALRIDEVVSTWDGSSWVPSRRWRLAEYAP